MPKIFIIILFIFSFINVNCQVMISPVLGNINSINSQLNFVQINDSLAYFTEFYFKDDKLKSSILQAKYINGEWFRNTIDKYKIENSNTGNFTHSHAKTQSILVLVILIIVIVIYIGQNQIN